MSRPPRIPARPLSSDSGQAKWTVRGVPMNIRAMAVAQASMRGMNLGDYVTIAMADYLGRQERRGFWNLFRRAK